MIILILILAIFQSYSSVSANYKERTKLEDFRQKKLNRVKHFKKSFDCESLNQEFVPGQVLVKYRELPQTLSDKNILKNNSHLRSKIVNNPKNKFFENIYLLKPSHQHKQLNNRTGNDCIELQQLIQEIKQDPNVEIAEPNFIYKSSATLNDPLMNESLNPPGLWGHKKIKVDSAWDLAQGDGVKVAVIDSGVDYTHPDISANIPYVGYDYIYNDLYPQDGTGHGTHVAGTISAIGNNSRGMVGVAYLSKIFPIRVLNEIGGNLYLTSDLISALDQASKNGAKVINLSLKGAYSSFIDQACDSLYDSGIAVIAASGNGGEDGIGDNEVNYPAGYASVLAVGSTNQNDELSEFSNYGNWVDVAAPGENILSLFSKNAYKACISTGSSSACLGNPKYLDDFTYGYTVSDGTSMATPHVSGLAALLYSYDQLLTVSDILSIITLTTDQINTSKEMGGGRVNAESALEFALYIKAMRTADINKDQLISDDETIRLAYNTHIAHYNFSRNYDLSNNNRIDSDDIQLFVESFYEKFYPQLKLSFINYLNIFYYMDNKRPYGIITRSDVLGLQKRFKQLIRKRRYVSFMDFDNDGILTYNDFELALDILAKL
jgi:thermitase